MKTIVRSLAVALLAVPALTFAADTFKIDGAHTAPGFSVTHFMVSTVRGEFGKTEGKASIDAADLTKSSIEVTIDAASINTRDEKRDGHLKSADFFDVAKFPTLTFKSTKVEKAGEALKVTGDLTMHGVTKPVVLDVKLTPEIQDPYKNTRRGVSATGKLNRKDFGVSYGPDAVVSDLVSLTIDAELIKEAPPAK
jgi:polyisoprenoid-binding protein YceI